MNTYRKGLHNLRVAEAWGKELGWDVYRIECSCRKYGPKDVLGGDLMFVNPREDKIVFVQVGATASRQSTAAAEYKSTLVHKLPPSAGYWAVTVQSNKVLSVRRLQ